MNFSFKVVVFVTYVWLVYKVILSRNIVALAIEFFLFGSLFA